MSVLFIDGFDLHARGGALFPGFRDIGAYWYTNDSGSGMYVDGYLTGQAMRHSVLADLGLRGGRWSPGNALTSEVNALRVYFVAHGTPPGGTVWRTMCRVVWGANKDFGIQIRDDGTIQLGTGAYVSGSPSDVIAASLGTMSPSFQTFEFLINGTANTVSLRINGTWVATDVSLSGTAGTIDTDSQPVVEFNRANAYPVTLDHIIITDGTALAPNLVHSLAPTASWRLTGGLVYGHLVVDGEQYRILPGARTVAGLPGSTVHDGPIHYWNFPNNPATDEPWTIDALSEIDAWGVCVGNFAPGGSIELKELALSVVETYTTGDHPIIRMFTPSSLAYYSGEWVKQDPGRSIAAHLNALPRPDDDADDFRLTTEVDGCLSFAGVEPAGGVFQGVGITFAEEYRTDFEDWSLALGGGLPFVSEFVSGYSVLGEGNKDFQSNYVTVNYEETPVGGAYLQGIWEYAIDGDSGRWSTQQQVYKPADDNFKHRVRKLKVRGGGKALQIKVKSEENKDFIINGWSILASGNTGV